MNPLSPTSTRSPKTANDSNSPRQPCLAAIVRAVLWLAVAWGFTGKEIKMNRNDVDPFLRGYLDAALFTTDDDVPGGCDYVDSGRADEMFPMLPTYFIEQARKDCAKFTVENCALLNQAGDPWQNGADFWYTRNGHGVGFWDRGYADAIADPLTEACKKFGPHDLSPDEIGQTTEA